MKTRFMTGTAMLALALFSRGAAAPTVESRLTLIEQRQDSILAILRSMQGQTEYVALRVGWKPAADTTPKVIPIGRSFTRGPANAAITLVEFSDLQCPYCAQLNPVLDAVFRAYPRDVRMVFKNFPLSFHPQSRPAAAAAMAAGNQGKFFEFASKVSAQFRNLNDSLYLAVAQDLGLDMKKFRRDMALTPEVNAILDADIQLGQQVGVEGTPAVYLNGKPAEDRSFEYFATIIEAARSRR